MFRTALSPLWLLLLVLFPVASPGATKLLVTVVDERTMEPVTDLKPGELEIDDNKRIRSVEKLERMEGLLDIALLVDASLVGEMVQPAAANIIEQLGEKDQMSIVAFDSSATLVQDFTSSIPLLLGSLKDIRYGNSPRILDAVYATVDGAFENTGFRRIIVLITAGMDAGSRTRENTLYRTAKRNEVTVYCLFVDGWRATFRDLAENTGGAAVNLRELQKRSKQGPGALVFNLIRSQYNMTISGDASLSEKAKVTVKRPGKYRVGFLELN